MTNKLAQSLQKAQEEREARARTKVVKAEEKPWVTAFKEPKEEHSYLSHPLRQGPKRVTKLSPAEHPVTKLTLEQSKGRRLRPLTAEEQALHKAGLPLK